MGRIVKLDNWTNCERITSGINSNNVILYNTSGTPYNIYDSTSYNSFRKPFYVYSTGNTYSVPDTFYPFPYACSDTIIDKSRYNLTNTFGTSTISFTRTNTGWTANIQIVHNAEATINSLLFVCKCWYNASSSQNFLFFAYILDNPIILNAENNYTANLTMSVSFE